MKKIKYIILSILSIGLLSCEDDNYSIAYVDDEVKTALVGSMSLNRSSAAPGTMVSFNYTLPQAFTDETVLEITAISTYDVLEVDASVVKSYVTVPAGQTTGTGWFKMSGASDFAPGDYFGVASHSSVSITGIAITQPDREDEDGNEIDPYVPIDDPYTMSSESISITGLDIHDPYMFPNLDDDDEPLPTLMVSLDWEGPYGWGENDLDLGIYSSDGFLFESSESGSRFEGDFFNNPANEDHPDGEYIVTTSIWTSVSADPIAYRISLTHPDGRADVYEGVIDPAVGFIEPVGFTKTTDENGKITYETYSLF